MQRRRTVTTDAWRGMRGRRQGADWVPDSRTISDNLGSYGAPTRHAVAGRDRDTLNTPTSERTALQAELEAELEALE